jgi:hypothetical protein
MNELSRDGDDLDIDETRAQIRALFVQALTTDEWVTRARCWDVLNGAYKDWPEWKEHQTRQAEWVKP